MDACIPDEGIREEIVQMMDTIRLANLADRPRMRTAVRRGDLPTSSNAP